MILRQLLEDPAKSQHNKTKPNKIKEPSICLDNWCFNQKNRAERDAKHQTTAWKTYKYFGLCIISINFDNDRCSKFL